MNQPERRAIFGEPMRVVETTRNLRPDMRNEYRRKRSHPRLEALSDLEQGVSAHVLHCQKAGVSLLIEVEYLYEIGMIEPRRQVRFGNEHADQLGIGRKEGPDSLDHEFFFETLRSWRTAEIQLRHSAFSQLAANQVFPERYSRSERQTAGR
jgi:hypothetical protein